MDFAYVYIPIKNPIFHYLFSNIVLYNLVKNNFRIFIYVIILYLERGFAPPHDKCLLFFVFVMII
jgi:hypothetical protein